MPAWIWPLLAAPFAGSLAGVLIRRLPLGRPVALARSCCEGCGGTLAARDLVPLFSYLVLRGRCRQCGRDIGRFHLAVELAALAVAGWAVLADPDGAWADCVLGWGLIALAWIDWDHLRLPDALTLPLVPLGLLDAWQQGPEVALDHAVAAITGYAVLRGVAWFYRRLRGREGLGGGDAKLLAVAGAWVGLAGLGPVLLVGALLGLGVAATRLRLAMAGAPIPFGPPLALAIWMVRLHG